MISTPHPAYKLIFFKRFTCLPNMNAFVNPRVKLSHSE